MTKFRPTKNHKWGGSTWTEWGLYCAYAQIGLKKESVWKKWINGCRCQKRRKAGGGKEGNWHPANMRSPPTF